ncbi:MAG: Ig-like domain-containing protein [Cytophaga sp.]|uniref:rhamnogalacturonan lyase family protein n=1 Tax=Cytophaga sp. TaxID=29535 RepID=UPI003F817244
MKNNYPIRQPGHWLRLFCMLNIFMFSLYAQAQFRMEKLDRGVIAVRTGNNNFISWRWLGTEPDNITFNLYRNGTKVNAAPLTVCNYTDNGAAATASYAVRAIIDGVEQTASAAVTPWAQQYMRVGIQKPTSDHTANDASIADLDGDGQWEIILKWDPSNAKDNSQSGVTGNVYIDAYKLNGTRLWRINLGKNIRAGAHYTQFMVYDFNSDGKAEMMCKTADGTTDAKGTVIGSATADYRNSAGYVLSGPEYLTVFNGETGAAMATVNYLPGRGTVSAWGDSYGNRVDRFRAGVAYLDGKKASAIFCRGYYTRLVVAAWDWNGSVLSSRWVFDSGNSSSNPFYGQGDHSLSVADVDNDGKQEIISGAAIIDDNGTGYYSTGFGHGDALHVSDLDPSLPGLEVFNIQERFDKQGCYMYSAKDKKVLWTKPSVTAGSDGEGPARGVCADISAAYPGAESWVAGAGITGVFDAKGNKTTLATPSSCNFLAWWDGDPLRELLNGTAIDKYGTGRLLTANNIVPVTSNNGTKSTPALSGDFFGDWREEVMWRSSANDALYIFTTTIPSTMKLRTLMHDPQYRPAIAWQNCAYNQPPHVSYFIGNGMAVPPAPNITIVGGVIANVPPTTNITVPANNTAYTAPASVIINASAADTDGTIASVDFYNGTTLIGTDAAAPYSFTWANVPAGTYSITTRATDNQGATGMSDPVTVIVQGTGLTIQGETACTYDGILNESINAGFNGTGYLNLNNVSGSAASWVVNAAANQTATLTIRYANASTASRNMSLKVNNTTQVASIAFPSTGAWTTWQTATATVNLAAGRNTLTLTSLIAEGAPNIDELTFSSSTVSIASCTPPNVAPTVSLTAPANSSSFVTPATLTLTATAADADGTVSLVEFYNGTSLLGSDAATPYTVSWNNVPEGNYTLTAKATDNAGAVTTSAAITVTVKTPVLSSIEAEAACSVDGILNEPTNAGFSGTGYVNTDNAAGASINWTIHSPASQTATLTLRYANASALNRAASLSVGGIIQAASIAFNTTAAWTTWNTVSVPVTLQAGNNAIELTALTTEGCANIDLLTFSSGAAVNISCTQLRTAEAASATTVAPNPATDVFRVSFQQAVSSVKVSDLNGNILFTQQSLDAGSTIEFGHALPIGMYTLIVVYTNGNVETKKIQKL